MPSGFSKDAVRQQAFNKRLTIPPAYQEEAAKLLMENFLKHVQLPSKDSVIAAYMPFNAELNVKPLMLHLIEGGYRVTIPHVMSNLSGLEFRTWTPKTPVRRNLHGIEEADVRHSEVLLPDLLIVPFIAFDARGNRMGYGSGQFDRTFATLKKVRKDFATVGVGFDSQREDEVPHDEYDYPLDMVVTEKAVYNCKENRK